MNKRVRLIITGRVQGVYFRVSTRDQVQKFISITRHEITGWVRNRLDGTVEVSFQGSIDVINNLVTWCNTGPSYSKVTSITVIDEEIITDEVGFVILPTK